MYSAEMRNDLHVLCGIGASDLQVSGFSNNSYNRTWNKNAATEKKLMSSCEKLHTMFASMVMPFASHVQSCSTEVQFPPLKSSIMAMKAYVK